MQITMQTLSIDTQLFAQKQSRFDAIATLLGDSTAKRTLAVNPRDGEYLHTLIKRKSVIDSFVSDNEWCNIAKSFSSDVFTGYSHRPLLSIDDATYDLIVVCEDIGFVDSCDAMLQEYYRLLKPDGVMIGGIWNIRYVDNIDRFIIGNGVTNRDGKCGRSLILLDVLTERLREIGFMNIDIFNLPGNWNDCADYVCISIQNNAPVEPEMFNAVIHFIRAVKQV